MFKGIIPSTRRQNSSQFEIIEKENLPDDLSVPASAVARNALKERNGQIHRAMPPPAHVPKERDTLDSAFETLLVELQIPSSLKPKLLGMDPIVKSAMLRSSHQISQAATIRPTTPKSKNTLRKTKSSEGLDSPRVIKQHAQPSSASPIEDPFASLFSRSETPAPGAAALTEHARGKSLSIPRSRSTANLATADQPNVKWQDISSGGIAPQVVARTLLNTSSTRLDVELVKKLRLLLRNEATSWTEEFMKTGGYSNMLTRLNELLEIEWREEQHDDMILHELLRCFKALSTSEIGCFALRSQCPRPFVQLVSLLYSDKKPGEVATRQVIIELLITLFDLFPPSQANLHAVLPPSYPSCFSLVRSILLTPKPPTAEALILPNPVSPHDFIASIHQPRIYRTYLQEISDICRDYFWIFCHPQNTIWILDEVDEGRVERPKAPGGMTGGVEYEAMSYMTTHLKLINSLCLSASLVQYEAEHELSIQRFHADLFASGFERILSTARKASTTYYPTMHLELSRYVDQARRSKVELPWTLTRAVGLPPSGLRKSDRKTPRGTPTKNPAGARPRNTVPYLHSPQKVDPLSMDA